MICCFGNIRAEDRFRYDLANASESYLSCLSHQNSRGALTGREQHASWEIGQTRVTVFLSEDS